MKVIQTHIRAVRIIEPQVHSDERGFFSETYNAAYLSENGICADFVQDNHSYSSDVGVLRGLHLQLPPYDQDKLIRVSRGRIWDVAVDLRAKSETFGQHIAVDLSRENWRQLLVPSGFAHGFVTLEPDTEVIYKVSSHYAPNHDAGIAYNDPDLGIQWPALERGFKLSEKDLNQPSFEEFKSHNPF